MKLVRIQCTFFTVDLLTQLSQDLISFVCDSVQRLQKYPNGKALKHAYNERSVVPYAANPITEGAEARVLGVQASLCYIMSLRLA